MIRLILVFTYVWQKDVEKITKVPGAPRNVNPAQTITRLEGVTIYCTIFQYNSPPPRQVLRDKIL